MPSPTELDAPVDDHTAAAVADFVGRVLAATRAATAETLASTDLTFSQVRVLFVLMQNDDGLPTHEVAEQVNLSLAATGRAADRLVAVGLVDRREDPRDRRVKRLSLSESGSDLMANHVRLRDEDVRVLLEPLPTDLRSRLRDVLAAAVAYLPDHGICRGPRPPTC
ncbi:MAG: MarR family winged helix-turn-helix transcriptional regulator [Gordonia sp. (in: high G+C Gram-positive bacteria)]|uniref:MarR family winged helix-turn-helix transcriptional regulator n=1 Tax=Gordonia sp. (in: high G+C Gram-positive bacteria) TaxID=84139 RepID=UPI0039E6F588